MSAVLEFYRCPSCDGHHDFCDPEAYILSDSAVYAFTCPTTGQEAELRDVRALAYPADECPPDAVVVRRVAP